MIKPTHMRAVEFTQDRILRLRTDRDLSQRQLADAAGIHPTTLGKIESKVSGPTVDTIYRLALALAVDPAEFLWSGDRDDLPPL